MNTQDVLNAQEIRATHADLATITLERLTLARDLITVMMLHMELRFMVAIIATCKNVEFSGTEGSLAVQSSLVMTYDDIMADHVERNGENRHQWSESEKEKLTMKIEKILIWQGF